MNVCATVCTPCLCAFFFCCSHTHTHIHEFSSYRPTTMSPNTLLRLRSREAAHSISISLRRNALMLFPLAMELLLLFMLMLNHTSPSHRIPQQKKLESVRGIRRRAGQSHSHRRHLDRTNDTAAAATFREVDGGGLWGRWHEMNFSVFIRSQEDEVWDKNMLHGMNKTRADDDDGCVCVCV